MEEELEVRSFCNNNGWDKQKLLTKISEEMADYITECIKPPSDVQINDVPWWMGNTQGRLTVKSAWDLMRQKQEQRKEYDLIWAKGIPIKINVFLWRVWKRRIAIDDNLKKLKIHIVSRCWCCENNAVETMSHLFLTAPIATRLWRQFAIFAGINMEGMHLQQLIINWWKIEAPPKLQVIDRAMPTFIMWSLWKRRNNKKHGGNNNYTEMVIDIQDLVKKLIKSWYPWIKLGPWRWLEVIKALKRHKPKLHFHSVTWRLPDLGKIKCNNDGACRGNPSMSSFGFCIRDDGGNFVYAKAKGIGVATNIEAEALAIREAIIY